MKKPVLTVVVASVLVLAGSAVAVAATSTSTDVQRLATAESNVVTLLHQYKPDAAWNAKFKAAEAVQAAALAKVNADLSPPAKSKPTSSTISFTDPNGVTYTVSLKEVIDPANGSQNAPPAGDRFVAAVFTVTDTSRSGSTSPPWNNADVNASAVGSDNQTYTFSIALLPMCTNFSDGSYQLGPGESATGCVAFALPTSVKVVEIKWSPSGPSGGSFGEWRIG
jgi:hypothetical protein